MAQSRVTGSANGNTNDNGNANANGKVLQIAFLRFWIIYKMCLLLKPSD